MTDIGLNTLHTGPEDQNLWLVPEVSASSIRSGLVSLLALGLALMAFTPLGLDVLWVAPLAAGAALILQVMAPKLEPLDDPSS